eukprot:TRINITY_DN4695_c0_g1_i1.p1 TRINITY_DN4695_c0_g1~~TRINITY_DN4695_c0_g1_i1.p1  ORF type:complete len:467 (+),score=108.10 TRINITY_DN4695_c0_g1_i1:228-1628(+)
MKSRKRVFGKLARRRLTPPSPPSEWPGADGCGGGGGAGKTIHASDESIARLVHFPCPPVRSEWPGQKKKKDTHKKKQTESRTPAMVIRSQLLSSLRTERSAAATFAVDRSVQSPVFPSSVAMRGSLANCCCGCAWWGPPGVRRSGKCRCGTGDPPVLVVPPPPSPSSREERKERRRRLRGRVWGAVRRSPPDTPSLSPPATPRSEEYSAPAPADPPRCADPPGALELSTRGWFTVTISPPPETAMTPTSTEFRTHGPASPTFEAAAPESSATPGRESDGTAAHEQPAAESKPADTCCRDQSCAVRIRSLRRRVAAERKKAREAVERAGKAESELKELRLQEQVHAEQPQQHVEMERPQHIEAERPQQHVEAERPQQHAHVAPAAAPAPAAPSALGQILSADPGGCPALRCVARAGGHPPPEPEPAAEAPPPAAAPATDQDLWRLVNAMLAAPDIRGLLHGCLTTTA